MADTSGGHVGPRTCVWGQLTCRSVLHGPVKRGRDNMRTPDRGPESPFPLRYEPKSARVAAPETTRGSEPRLTPLPLGHGKPAPPRKLTKRKGSFEGDVAIKDLRERMARTPDLPPEPPMRDGGGSAFGKVGRLFILVTMTAIAAYVFVWTSTARDGDGGFTLATYGNPLANEGPALNNTGVNTASANDANLRTAVFQLPHVPEAQTDMMRARDDAPPTDGPQVHRLVPWPASDSGALGEAKADDVVVSAPADTVSLRRSPPAEASQAAPPVSKAPRINDKEMANLLESGRTFLIIGDVTAARLAFRRAAESGNAQAALALGGTFDPLVLKSLGAVGVAADPAHARGWYQNAAELGSRDAPQRLNELTQSVR
jgi:hypothetical protein